MVARVEPHDTQARLHLRPVSPASSIGVTPSSPGVVELLASQTLSLQGDVYQLVTFLNHCLQERHLEFGLRRQDDGRYQLSVYQVKDSAHEFSGSPGTGSKGQQPSS